MADHDHGPGGHTHGPGGHSHTHGPTPPQPQPQMMPPQPDPLQQAALDERFRPVPLRIVPSTDPKVPPRVESTDKASPEDFSYLNALGGLMAQLIPPTEVPPPINPQTVTQNPRSAALQKAKDEGNKLYGAGQHAKAIQMYSAAADITATRPFWESSGLMREELAIVLCNRSAAHAVSGDWVSALVDANAVIFMKRPWSKGHFRKAKALQGLEDYEEARDALKLGLSFEPSNLEMRTFLIELEEQIKTANADKALKRSQKLQSPTDAPSAS